ncbi:hypothetical protein ZIOFF_058870 [Zingiber officinale]|uniref:Pectinesterase catalytic domain-containing protein n=1 Tax=Zingiber officinale TaxID=94328 RepID=A0A8J5KIR2_ZINOF|nr:hypothetical protein ZIOFF_058870 [Zingiber officinale]
MAPPTARKRQWQRGGREEWLKARVEVMMSKQFAKDDGRGRLYVDIHGCFGEYDALALVQEAVDAAPDLGSDQFVIHIKAGVYEEMIRVPFEKTNLVFVGDGMGATVISSSRNNKAGLSSHQLVAFHWDSDHSVLESVEFRGHQGTLYAHSLLQLYRICKLGFIFGNSAVVFDRCSIEVVPRAKGPAKAGSKSVAAHGRINPAQGTGFMFNGCSINRSADYLAAYRRKPGAHREYLGRPWKEYSRMVHVNCYMEEMVMPEGWLP